MMTLIALLLAQAATPAVTAAKDPDKKICKREVATGSLVRATKTCKTRAEWERAYAAAREKTEEFRRPIGGCPGTVSC